jgi:hypothetical protein
MPIVWPGDTASAAYAPLVLDQIKGGNFEVSWGTVVSDAGGHHGEFRVFADALKIEGVRIDVSAYLEQQIADLLGCSLLTPKLVDLGWQQRATTLPPDTQTITSSSAGMIRHSTTIDAQLAKLPPTPAGGIIRTVGKNWCIDNDLLRYATGKAENYGWHFEGPTLGGKSWEPSVTDAKQRVIQGRGWFHDFKHIDYSQTCLLVARQCLVDGQPMDLQAVLSSAELAPLASHQGKMTVLRQPGVPELAPLFAATPEASSPFRRASYSDTGPIPTSSSQIERKTDWGAVFWSGAALAATVGLFWWGLKAMDKAAKGRRLREGLPNPVETFAQAKARVMNHLEAQGWRVARDLKVPHATSPDGAIRVWFKPQALYLSVVHGRGLSHTLGMARSLWIDPRGVDAAKVEAAVRHSAMGL